MAVIVEHVRLRPVGPLFCRGNFAEARTNPLGLEGSTVSHSTSSCASPQSCLAQ